MKVSINPKSGTPDLTLDEKDLSDAYQVEVMMRGRGWKVLSQYLAFAREALIDAIKESTRSPEAKEMCAEKAATLKGFDEFVKIPHKIVTRAQEFVDKSKEIEGGDNNGADAISNAEF